MSLSKLIFFMALAPISCTGAGSSESLSGTTASTATLMSQVTSAMSAPSFKANFQTLRLAKLDDFTSTLASSINDNPYVFNGESFSGLRSGLAKLSLVVPAETSPIRTLDDALGSQGVSGAITTEDVATYLSVSEATMSALAHGKTELDSSIDAQSFARALRVAMIFTSGQVQGALQLADGPSHLVRQGLVEPCNGKPSLFVQNICVEDGNVQGASVGGFSLAKKGWVDAYSGASFPACTGAGNESDACSAWSTNPDGKSCHRVFGPAGQCTDGPTAAEIASATASGSPATPGESGSPVADHPAKSN